MQRIYVVTHTEAQHHVDRLVGGWYDSHLTERGVQQAEAIAERLAAEIGGDDVSVYTSDLARTAETAAPIARRFATAAQPLPDLREMNFGIAGGRPKAWLDERFVPAPDDNRLDHASSEGAETKRALATRIYSAVDRIAAEPSPTKVVVTHGYALTFVIAAWIRMPIDAVGHVNFGAGPGGITLFEEDDVLRNRAVLYVNDRSHLS
jgi:broad specificity phosphatase PhoE